MAYYRGDYYRGKGRGDYYRGKGRGDPGFWSAIGRGLGVVGAAVAAPYTGGASLGMIPALLGGSPSPLALPDARSTAMSFTRVPKVEQLVLERQGPPGSKGPFRPDVELMPMRRRYRRMNPANVKALRRSLRRVSSFGRLASSARKAIVKAASAVQVRRIGRVQRLLPPGRGK